jgi:hypothetical protein
MMVIINRWSVPQVWLYHGHPQTFFRGKGEFSRGARAPSPPPVRTPKDCTKLFKTFNLLISGFSASECVIEDDDFVKIEKNPRHICHEKTWGESFYFKSIVKKLETLTPSFMIKKDTKVKLGYNEHSIITNKIFYLGGLGHFYDSLSWLWRTKPVKTNKIWPKYQKA